MARAAAARAARAAAASRRGDSGACRQAELPMPAPRLAGTSKWRGSAGAGSAGSSDSRAKHCSGYSRVGPAALLLLPDDRRLAERQLASAMPHAMRCQRPLRRAARAARTPRCVSLSTPIRIAAKKPRDVFCMNNTWKTPKKRLNYTRAARRASARAARIVRTV